MIGLIETLAKNKDSVSETVIKQIKDMLKECHSGQAILFGAGMGGG